MTLASLLWAGSVLALDPALEASQYGHTAWRIRDGFTRGAVISIAQTPDGYLWLGTEFGLVRFDGVRSVPWVPPQGAALPSEAVRTLLAARDGTLWIGTSRGLAAWDGRALLSHPRLEGSMIHALQEDREGTLWVGATEADRGLLCAIRGATTECHGGDGSLANAVASVYEQSNGVLWAAAGDQVWRWKPAPPKAYAVGVSVGSLQAIGETAAGAMVFGTGNGMRIIAEDLVVPFPLPASSV
jgi:ligand-binding sensor domain-containing protein